MDVVILCTALFYLVGTPNTIDGGIFFNLFKDLSLDADDTLTS